MDHRLAAVFPCQVIVASAWHTHYSLKKNYISDLGNTACGPFAVPHGTSMYVCSPSHTLMNLSFMASGVLTIVGAALLRRAWPIQRLTSVAFVLWLITGLGKVMVGLFPENTNVGLHLLGALNIPIGSVAILLLSLAIRGDDRLLGWTGICLGAVGLIGSILSTVGPFAGSALYLGLGVGGMERVSDYPGVVWVLLIGCIVIWRAASQRRPAGPIFG